MMNSCLAIPIWRPNGIHHRNYHGNITLDWIIVSRLKIIPFFIIFDFLFSQVSLSNTLDRYGWRGKTKKSHATILERIHMHLKFST